MRKCFEDWKLKLSLSCKELPTKVMRIALRARLLLQQQSAGSLFLSFQYVVWVFRSSFCVPGLLFLAT